MSNLVHYGEQRCAYPSANLCRGYIKIILVILCLLFTAWILLFILPSASSSTPAKAKAESHTPTIQLPNGTLSGLYNAKYDQDLFLGIPYAQPPVAALRFTQPQHLNTKWKETRLATKYSPHCFGYRDYEERFPKSEDCLTLNVVQPAGFQHRALAVGVYIHGGGTHGGGTSYPRYNLSFLVSHAAQVGLPFIGVSFNYRYSLWGFIAGREVAGTGNSNIGLRDQRLALNWIHSNIAAFGGDPSQVTIWGGSSGADSVGFHLTASGGRDDKLFRAAIMQSGSPVAATESRTLSIQEEYERLLGLTKCNESEDSLECLRCLPEPVLNNAFNNSAHANSKMMRAFSQPSVDGEFIEKLGSLQVKGTRYNYLIYDQGYPKVTIESLLDLYPNTTSDQQEPLISPIGSIRERNLFERVKAVIGDIESKAAHRFTCATFSTSSHCFSYIFDAIPSWIIDPRIGVPHGAEISPLFQNVDGLGFEGNAFSGKEQGYYRMSKLMGTMWAGFITAMDPNVGLVGTETRWPVYDTREPRNFVFSESRIGFPQNDDDRIEAIEYINRFMAGSFGK